MMTALGLALLGVGVLVLYAIITGQSLRDEFAHAIGRT